MGSVAKRPPWFTLGLLFLLAACWPAVTPTSTQSPPAVQLRLGFADSVRPLMETVLPIYSDEIPILELETEVGNAVVVLDDLQAGRIEAALLPLDLDSEDERWISLIALDGLALIANPENPVTGLTVPQARAIFQGRIWSWDAVGGAAAEIEVVTREKHSAAREGFQRAVMEEHRVTLMAVVMANTAAVLDHVALHPHAIGYCAAASVNNRVKLLAVEGLYPSPETLANQSYPLTLPIYFVALEEPVGPLRQFVAWLVSRDGQAVVSRRYSRVR